MHTLDFLKQAIEPDNRSIENSVRVEYRLVCSGTLFPTHVLGDWSKSDCARVLLRRPVELLVASTPYDDYPQELVLRFVASLVTAKEGEIEHVGHYDEEIASDIAALLTLICRRLVTVSAKVRTQYHTAQLPPILADYPTPAVTTARLSYWKPRPIDFFYTLDGVQVRSYHPPPHPFDAVEMGRMLSLLPDLSVAPAVLRAARLYASAMERIESQPAEICYQLLISAAETMAGTVLEGWQPDTQTKIASKGALVSYATQTEKLSKDVAERLAMAASKDNPWSRRKFKRFLLENLNREAIRQKDELFILLPEFCPKEEQFERAIEKVYDTRGGATHSGYSYPAAASLGPSPRIPVEALDAIIKQQCLFPPIGWFERIVNNAICGFLRSQLDTHGAGATEVQKQTPTQEDWWQFMQRTRRELEAAGRYFMNEEEVKAHIEWLREEDRIDELLRQADVAKQ